MSTIIINSIFRVCEESRLLPARFAYPWPNGVSSAAAGAALPLAHASARPAKMPAHGSIPPQPQVQKGKGPLCRTLAFSAVQAAASLLRHVARRFVLQLRTVCGRPVVLHEIPPKAPAFLWYLRIEFIKVKRYTFIIGQQTCPVLALWAAYSSFQ